MLRIICSENASHAKNYYTSNLKYEADPSRLGRYYGQEQEVIGEWQGKGAELLGLTGRVDQKSFEALCDNKRPGTNDRLGPVTIAVWGMTSILTARRVSLLSMPLLAMNVSWMHFENLFRKPCARSNRT